MLDQQIEEFMRRSSNISKIVDIDSGDDFTVKEASQSAEQPKATDLSRNSVMSEFRRRLMARLESRSSTQRSYDQILLSKFDNSESDNEEEAEVIEFDRTAIIRPSHFDAAKSPSLRKIHTKLSDIKLSSFKKPAKQQVINGFERVYTYEDDEHSTQDILTELKFKNTNEDKNLLSPEEPKLKKSTGAVPEPIKKEDVSDPTVKEKQARVLNPMYIFAVVILVISMMIAAELRSLFSNDI